MDWFSGNPTVNQEIEAQVAANNTAKANAASTTNTDAASTLTLTKLMVNEIVFANSASAQTVSVDTDANQPIPIGSQIVVIQVGAGLVTFSALSGATLNKIAATLKSNGRYSRVVVTKIAANTYTVNGDLSAT